MDTKVNIYHLVVSEMLIKFSKESFKWFSINIKIFLPLFEKNKYIFLLFGLIIIPDELNSTYLS